MLKPLQELEVLDKESDDILNMMFDEQSGADHRTLVGHSGPVFSVSFSPDKYYILSGSEDGTSNYGPQPPSNIRSAESETGFLVFQFVFGAC